MRIHSPSCSNQNPLHPDGKKLIGTCPCCGEGKFITDEEAMTTASKEHLEYANKQLSDALISEMKHTKLPDLETQDFYEVMQAYRHSAMGADEFEKVKEWLRNPTYTYEDAP